MPLSGESTVELELPIEQVWEFLIDVEDAPRWQDGLKSLTVTARDAQGLPAQGQVEIDVKLRSLGATVRFQPTVPTRLHITQIKGDLKSVTTGWELTDLGAGRTRVRYYAEAELGRLGLLLRGPLLDVLRHQLAGGRAGELQQALTR